MRPEAGRNTGLLGSSQTVARLRKSRHCTTGAITLARAPAGTDSDVHILTIQGTDAHGQEATATVAITVTP